MSSGRDGYEQGCKQPGKAAAEQRLGDGIDEGNREYTKQCRQSTQCPLGITKELDPAMEQVVVDRGLDVGGCARRDLVNFHARQVDAEPLVIPQALTIQTIKAKDQRQKNRNQQEHRNDKA